jgi:hypothetical protein
MSHSAAQGMFSRRVVCVSELVTMILITSFIVCCESGEDEQDLRFDTGSEGIEDRDSATEEDEGPIIEDPVPDFDPCPTNGEACRILPLGDSITDGMGVTERGGYRVELFRLAHDSGKNITFIGEMQNGPEEVDDVPFPSRHEGHPGWIISQIDDIVSNAAALDTHPHIILLHIGTNDMGTLAPGARYRLGALLDHIIAESPDALLVVSTIIPFPCFSDAVSHYNAAIPEMVRARAQRGAKVILVDQFAGFPVSELADGIHPNRRGYSRMAGVWYHAIDPYLR